VDNQETLATLVTQDIRRRQNKQSIKTQHSKLLKMINTDPTKTEGEPKCSWWNKY